MDTVRREAIASEGASAEMLVSALDLVADHPADGSAANSAACAATGQNRTGNATDCGTDSSILVSGAHIRAGRESAHCQHECQGSRHRLHAVLQLLSVVGRGRRFAFQL